jgi:hypothetical protein
VAADGTLLRTIDGSTSPSGAFSRPAGVAVDPATGDVYVTDSDKEVLQRFTAGGAFVAQISVNVNQDEFPAVDPATGALYVADGSTVFIVGTPPAVSGTPLDGSTLYASRPTQIGRGPFTYAYQWLECTAPGTCADHGSPMSTNGLRLTPADEGKTFAVKVTSTGAAGTVGPVTSDPVGPVAPAPPVNQAPPTISGTQADGAVLSATHGTWSGATVTSYAYRWQSCSGGSCVDVGTNAAAYRLAPTDVGHTIRVGVTATNADGTAGPAVATPVGPITPSPPSDQVPPRVTGTAAPGNRLQGSAGTWTGVLPIAYAYQWQSCPDGTPATCADIPGATLNNYRLTPADTTVRLVVTATNLDGSATAASLLAP